MIDTRGETERVEALRLQQLGEDWIRAIQEGALDRLAQFCSPKITGRLLLPGGLVTLNNVGDLIAEYRDWFGGYSSIQVKASRVGRVGSKLGIFYSLLLGDGRTLERIEQQLYCIVKDGRVQQLHLVCSGFHPAETDDQPQAPDPMPG